MSILGKLKFWKREEDVNFDEIANREMGKANPFETEQPFGEPAFPEEASPFESAPGPSPQQFTSASRAALYPSSSSASNTPLASSGNRELELINSKLDTIRAMLNSIEQRLDKLDKSEAKPPQRLW